MTSTWMGVGSLLKFVICFADSFLFLNKRSVVNFLWMGGGVTKLVIFFGRHKCMARKWFKLQPIQLLQAVVSSSTSSHCHCIENNNHLENNNHSPRPPPLIPSPNLLMNKPKHPLLSVGT